MRYKIEEIKALKKPYKELGSGDALAEHLDELNQLNDQEMRSLASAMVLDCPRDELNQFGHAIEAARRPQDDEKSFHAALSQAYEVKKRIFSLFDPRNANPHKFILDSEFDEALFNNYNELALDVLRDNETAIAQRLALTTPKEDRSRLALNIRNMFPQTVLVTKIGAAFTLRRNIDELLLGEEPEKFFLSNRDFSVDLCLEFSGLFPKLLEGHEKTIGEKLSTIKSPNTLSDIGRKLEQITHKAHNQDNPFRLIASAMIPKKEQPKQETTSQTQEKTLPEVTATKTTNPNSLFGNSEQRKPVTSSPYIIDEDYDSEEEDESSQEDSCCSGWCKTK